MDVTEPRHAATELLRRDRMVECFVGCRSIRREVRGLDIDMRPRMVMPAPQVARGIAGDRREHASRVIGPVTQCIAIGAAKQRVERVLDDIERIGRVDALAPRNPGQPACMGACQSRDPVTATTAGSVHGV